MEVLYVLLGATVLTGLWFLSGWIVVSSVNFVNMYFKGQRMFDKYAPCHPAVGLGPLMFVWVLYPVWLLIKALYNFLYENLGRTVVVEDIRKYSSSYRHTCLSKSSVKSLSNFFNVYMEKETSKFYHTDTGDKNAIENFFRVDGWRNVGDGVWTKIVKVKDLNEQN